MNTTFIIQGGNPNDCPTFPFCGGNSACNSGKCPDEPGAPIDSSFFAPLILVIITVIVIKTMSKSILKDGSGVLSLLGASLVILKLTNIIDWSWWYVTIPFSGGLGLLLLVSAIIYIRTDKHL